MSVVEASRGAAIEARQGRTLLTLARIAVIGGLIGFVAGAALIWTMTRIDDRQITAVWTRQQLNPVVLFNLRPAEVEETGEATEHAVAIRLLTRMGIAGMAVAILCGGGLAMLVRNQWIRIAREAALDQLLKGSRVATAKEVASLVKPAKGSRPITIGGVPLPPGSENRHLLLAGATGSGKTTALHHIVDQIAERGEAAILFDPDGSYVSHHYRPERGDVILNPLDARSARWNPVADVAGLLDAYRIASILLPKPANTNESAVWFDQARSVVAHLIDHLASSGSTDLDALSTMLNTTSADTLRAMFANTAAARIFERGADKATHSVLFMMAIAARSVAMLAMVPPSAPAFSFDAFFADLDQRTGPRPFVFLCIPRRYREAGAPLIAAWVDAAASAILQRAPGATSNAWIMLDELPSLPPIASLLTLLPEGRKHGACVTFGFQSIAQLRQVYSEDGTQVLTGQTSTQLLMKAGDHPTAQWAVSLAGTVEVENRRASDSLSTDAKGERGSLAVTRERKTLLIDAEMAELAPGEGFLRLAGLPIAKIRIAPPTAVTPMAPAFVPASLAPQSIAMPPAVPSQRIEDRDDWMSLEGPF